MTILETPKKWHHETDVIIVGGGTAGLPAAITVAEAGLKATVIESKAVCGGSFSMIAGAMAFSGTDEQKVAGVEDSPDILYEDMTNIAGAVPELARAYADNQIDAYRMLREVGIKFPGLVSHPGHSRLRTHGWVSEIVSKFAKALEGRAKDRGVVILLKHRASRLITDPQTGRIIGLKVIVKGETKSFKAQRAVILATGGFGRNRGMVSEYAPNMVDTIPMMPVGHQGDGLKMGLDMGAATKDIGIAVAPSFPVCIETHSVALPALDYGGIMVNIEGRRFYAESSTEYFCGPMTGAGMRQPGGVYWVVYNDRIKGEIDNKRELRWLEKCRQYKADTIEEVAKSAGIDAKGLKETIAKYNRDLDIVGYDTVFGRKSQFAPEKPLVKIDTPPFHAIKCITSVTSLKGGLKVNALSQVISQYGEVIPGLYAAGEVIGGLYTKAYLSGVMSSSSMTFGIIAGRNAAKEPAWE